MDCSSKADCPAKVPAAADENSIASLFPDTLSHRSPWKFYNHLIGGIPEGPVVTDYCLGTHWSYVEADCEYVLPTTDYAFITGVTIINKTAPRLLELTEKAHTVMIGPSVVMAPYLFKWGVEMMACSVVADPEKTRFAVKNGSGQFFGEALQMLSLTAK